MRITDNYSPTHCSDSVFSFVECRVCVFLLCVSVISGGGGAALAAGPASAQIRRFAVLISERDPHRKNEHATQCAPQGALQAAGIQTEGNNLLRRSRNFVFVDFREKKMAPIQTGVT